MQAFAEAAGIPLPMRDTLRDVAARRELLAGGGRATVPCLKIVGADGAERWLYESARIIDYLRANAAQAGAIQGSEAN